MTVFLDEIQESISKQAQVEKVQLEGSKIVIYAKKPEFFGMHQEVIKGIVDKYKKRVDVRADASVLMEPDHAKKKIMELVPKESD
ncbi:MAG: beta-CASP ribonuclease aCPSF1, partial [archaeon]